jgi:hypothetical protein
MEWTCPYYVPTFPADRLTPQDVWPHQPDGRVVGPLKDPLAPGLLHAPHHQVEKESR